MQPLHWLISNQANGISNDLICSSMCGMYHCYVRLWLARLKSHSTWLASQWLAHGPPRSGLSLAEGCPRLPMVSYLSPGSVYIIVLMCGSPMLLMRGRRLTHLDAGSCNSFMHDRFDNGCWPGRWARWEMEGTLTKWSYYSLSGHRPWELFRSLLIRLSQKSKKYSLPVCVCPLPSSQQSWGWVGKEILGGNKKPNCLADEPRQLMIWLISPPDLGSPCFTCDAGGTTHP